MSNKEEKSKYNFILSVLIKLELYIYDVNFASYYINLAVNFNERKYFNRFGNIFACFLLTFFFLFQFETNMCRSKNQRKCRMTIVNRNESTCLHENVFFSDVINHVSDQSTEIIPHQIKQKTKRKSETAQNVI